MKIYFNNKPYLIKDLHLISKHHISYSNLINFMLDWKNNQQVFEFKTSGSTGKPKAIDIKRSQIESSVMMTQKALNLSSQDKVLICLNPAYIATVMMVARCLILDMDMIIIEPKSDPFISLPADLPIDFASFVSFQIEEMVNNNQAEKLGKIRNILIGGAAISSQLKEKLKLINTNIYQSYGMTETVSHIALMNIHIDNTFNVLDDIEINIDDRDCLAIKGSVTDGEWIQTNDIINLINPNEFRWIGRADNVINSGGIKIFSEELESYTKEVLSDYNFSNDFFYYGEEDEKLGEKICLVFEKNIPRKEIITILKDRIISRFSKHHIPRKIHSIETFSKSSSGKVRRNTTIGNKPL